MLISENYIPDHSNFPLLEFLATSNDLKAVSQQEGYLKDSGGGTAQWMLNQHPQYSQDCQPIKLRNQQLHRINFSLSIYQYTHNFHFFNFFFYLFFKNCCITYFNKGFDFTKHQGPF